ncbi:MAG: right-handed parallel beta-helix repeat-containing protein [Victivallales bacterium]|nr:right-handed parallel beta-helix repeat-containing protein [Victivallales bacterium]
MKIASVIMLVAGLFAVSVSGAPAADAAAPLAFPGAVGFGIHTSAGRGGKVLRVTNLDHEGPGSLREALAATGPRIVVFEVGGIIDLKTRGMTISKPFLTIAGETAPSPGITLIRGGLGIRTHDVVVRHLRVRPGDAERPRKSGWEPDGITAYTGDAYNVVIDHCSVTWAVDENISTSGARTEGPDKTAHKVTISNCIIAEGLDNSSHKKGRHSKGTLIHDFCRDIAVIGNLYAHNQRRNPFFKAHATGVVVNNVIYNPGSAAIQMSWAPREWRSTKLVPLNSRATIVGNVFIHGADTKSGLALVARQGDAYLEDNLATDRKDKPVPMTQGKIVILKDKPVWPEGFEALPAAEVVPHVVKHVGARPQDRDPVDQRIIRQFLAREGRIIDSQTEVGGYPKATMTRRALTVPETGIDAWLATFAAAVE